MELPIPRKTLNITQNQNGGFNPMDVVIKIGLNNININNYIIKSLDNHISFSFTEKNKKISAGNKYLGAGGLTTVYSINMLYCDEVLPEKYKNKLNKYSDKLILRIFEGARNNRIQKDVHIGDIDTSNDIQAKFMEGWASHKEMFPENIIDLFLYGDLLINNEYLGYYSITRVYGNEDLVINLDFIQRMHYLKNLYTFLIKLKQNGLTYRDLKIANVGIDLDNFNFIVIDYDDVTLIKPSVAESFANNQSLHYSVGTHAPIYFLDNIRQNNFNINYSLIYLYGLFDIVRYMFKKYDFKTYKYDIVVNAIFDFITDFETLWQPIYNLLSCVYKNKSIPANCKTYVKIINIKYNTFIKKKYISGFKENIAFIDKLSENNDIDFILIILISYILYPLIVDNYEEASTYSQIENYTKIIQIIDIIISKSDNNYRQKYLKYKTKYLQLKQ